MSHLPERERRPAPFDGWIVPAWQIVAAAWQGVPLEPREPVKISEVDAAQFGHLLLGPGHSPTGIMRASWRREDYECAPRGAFNFTAKQSEQMRAEVKGREHQQAAQAPSLAVSSS